MLWLDCDREGEHIAYEVLSIVQGKRPRVRAFRARFSSLIEADLWRAVGALGQLDPRQRDVRACQSIGDMCYVARAVVTSFFTRATSGCGCTQRD